MTRIKYLAYLWAFVITQTGFVCSDTRFLRQHEGESVVLPCETEQRNPVPYSVYLKRTWLQPMEVLFMHTKEEFKVSNDADKNRTSVSGDPSLRVLHVTISQLKASDTDRYYCEFVVNNPSSKDDRIPGKTEFFLLVGAGCSGFMCTNDHCGGSCYSSLLYTLPLAVVILSLLLTGFVVIRKCKAHKTVKPHPEASVYEEMVGVKPPDQTQAPVHLEEQFIYSSVKKGSSENPHESQEKFSPTS